MTVIHNAITGVPESIAVDSLARNIYWTDPTSDTISVARLDGTYKKVSLFLFSLSHQHKQGGWLSWI